MLKLNLVNSPNPVEYCENLKYFCEWKVNFDFKEKLMLNTILKKILAHELTFRFILKIV